MSSHDFRLSVAVSATLLAVVVLVAVGPEPLSPSAWQLAPSALVLALLGLMSSVSLPSSIATPACATAGTAGC